MKYSIIEQTKTWTYEYAVDPNFTEYTTGTGSKTVYRVQNSSGRVLKPVFNSVKDALRFKSSLEKRKK